MDKKAQRILAGFTCAAFVIVAFFSLLFIAKEAHHDCTGEDCPVCACIHRAEQTLKQIGTGSSETAGAFAPQFPLVVAFLCLPLFAPVVSLISQKVRMNNEIDSFETRDNLPDWKMGIVFPCIFAPIFKKICEFTEDSIS